MYEKQIEAGMLFLDGKSPGWRDEIDLTTLEMYDPRKCILGQLYGSFGFAVYQLKLTWETTEKLGFLILVEEPEETWPELTAEWVEALEVVKNDKKLPSLVTV